MSEVSGEICPFCEFVRTGEPVAANGTFFAKYDEYPVSCGHILLIPRRHIATPFELDETESRDCHALLLQVRDLLERRFHPDGFTIGINVGPAAGQTVMHLHVHVIPRYVGDTERPEGGVRRVIRNLVEYPPQVG